MLLFAILNNNCSIKEKIIPGDQLFIFKIANIAAIYIPYHS